MCKTTTIGSYQKEHVSMEEMVEKDVLEDDDKNEKAAEDAARRRKRRRCHLFTLVTAFFFLVILACALWIHHEHKHQQQNVKSAPSSLTLDDDFVLDTDDDSVFYHGEPVVEDEKELSFDKDGTLNLQILSKATVKAGNVTSMDYCETTVLLMRHCEKTGDGTIDADGNQHCDYVGHERAHWIPTLFGSHGSNARWPAPSYLYALSPNRGSHKTYREVETLQPLADKFHLPIQAQYGTNNDLIQDLFHVLSSGQACSQLTVVNWQHHMMPNLAKKLGCKSCPMAYPEDSFDQVWQLKFVWDVPNTAVYSDSSNSMASSSGHDGSAITTSSVATHPPTSTRFLRQQQQRQLKTSKADATKTKKKHKESYEGPLWSVYSHVTYQYFDPLHVSGSVGDYHDSNAWMTQSTTTSNATITNRKGSGGPHWLHNNFDEGER